MKVLKFGGTSLATGNLFIKVANILIEQQKTQQVGVVLSAPAKVTDCLVNMIDKVTAKTPYTENFVTLDTIIQRILSEIHQQFPNFKRQATETLLQNELTQLQQRIEYIQQLGSCPDSSYAAIVCTGEKLSVICMRTLLEALDHTVTVIDPVLNLLVINDDYRENVVDLKQSTERITKLNIPKQDIIVMAGFTAGNKQQEIVALGRNGSDYSAAILASCMHADSCEIWTDVDGLYTSDPRLVPDAQLIECISYAEAIALTFFGATILHPKTIAPIIASEIPCYIKNTKNPNGTGTVITKQGAAKSRVVTGITHLNHIAMFNLSGFGLKSDPNIAARLFSALSKANLSLVLISQSSAEYSIAFCIEQNKSVRAKQVIEQEFEQEFASNVLQPLVIDENLAIVTIVGDGMKSSKGFSANVFTAIARANINIVAIAQDSSERSISIVLKQTDAVIALKVIHQSLFNTEQIVNLFLIGTGGVGQALLEQIRRQQHLLHQQKVDLRVCGIINSKKYLFNFNGIKLDNWQQDFKQADSYTYNDLDELIKIITDNKLLSPTIVDCTSSEKVVDHYIDFIVNGFHIVTPNKIANTREYDFYLTIRELIRLHCRQFKYDTNVGAGLPVIENLQNLLKAGDKLVNFSGILSGSLSFIFGKLEEGLTLSQAVTLAVEKGYTEPDPRDDLSGLDVARKLLIIAREVGYPLEMADISIESIIPTEYFEYSLTEFMQKLPALDQVYQKRIEDAHRENKVLRYIAHIDATGKCSASIVALDAQKPLANIKDGENALSFLTDYYQPSPLVLRGYGAGYNVTAAGVFADILRIASTNQLGIQK